MAYYNSTQQAIDEMIANAIEDALARASEVTPRELEVYEPPSIGFDQFETTGVADDANNNGMGISTNIGLDGNDFMNNHTFVNTQTSMDNHWAMAPNLAAPTNYANMAAHMPMTTDVAMSNPMVTTYNVPTISTTMATGQFFTGAPNVAGTFTLPGNNVSAGPSTSIGMVAGANTQATTGTNMANGQSHIGAFNVTGALTMAGNNVSAGPSTSIGMVAGPNTQATAGNNAMAMSTNPTMPAPAARPAARTSPARAPRPTGPRVPCTMCDEHPGGFRGRHELNRHVRLKHNNQGGKYICLDPGNAATVNSKKIQLLFNECRRCLGAKQYNSVQNAIDHLRRGHFIPKWHPGFEDKDRVYPRELPAQEFLNWVQTVGATAPTGPQPTNQAPAVAPPPAPQAPVVAPPAPQNPAATPESTVSSSDQGSDATSSVASGENTVSPPDAERPMFKPETVMFLWENHCVVGQEETIDPPL